jgi:preprotein translocase subunit SecG
MSEILMIIEVILAVLLILIILIQNKNVTLNLTSMGWWMWTVVKRWPEKILHNITIILAICFSLDSLLFFLLY